MLLRRTLRTEAAIALVVLGTTGALAGYPPANTVAAGPYATDARIGPARLEVTVDPARVGANQMHLYLFNRADGRQYDATKELTVRASLPGKRHRPDRARRAQGRPRPQRRHPRRLRRQGRLEVEVVARVSEFDEFRTSFEVPIQ